MKLSTIVAAIVFAILVGVIAHAAWHVIRAYWAG